MKSLYSLYLEASNSEQRRLAVEVEARRLCAELDALTEENRYISELQLYPKFVDPALAYRRKKELLLKGISPPSLNRDIKAILEKYPPPPPLFVASLLENSHHTIIHALVVGLTPDKESHEVSEQFQNLLKNDSELALEIHRVSWSLMDPDIDDENVSNVKVYYDQWLTRYRRREIGEIASRYPRWKLKKGSRQRNTYQFEDWFVRRLR